MHGLLRITWRYLACIIVCTATVSLLFGQITTKVGPQQGSDGTTPAARSNRLGSLGTFQAQGKYAESVFRGNCYVVSNGTAGQAVGAAVSTTASVVTVWNPTGSGKTFRFIRASLGYTSGTMGAGSFVYVVNNTNTATNPTGGTSLTPFNAFVGAANSSVSLCSKGATLAATPTLAEPVSSSFAELATTANGFQTINDDLDGRYVMQPGNGLSIQFIGTAGTSPVMFAAMFWEEILQGQE